MRRWLLLLVISLTLLLLPLQLKAQTIVQTCTGSANSGGAGQATCGATWGANHVLVIGGAANTNGSAFLTSSNSSTSTVVDSQSVFFPAFFTNTNSILVEACALTGAGGTYTWTMNV